MTATSYCMHWPSSFPCAAVLLMNFFKWLSANVEELDLLSNWKNFAKELLCYLPYNCADEVLKCGPQKPHRNLHYKPVSLTEITWFCSFLSLFLKRWCDHVTCFTVCFTACLCMTSFTALVCLLTVDCHVCHSQSTRRLAVEVCSMKTRPLLCLRELWQLLVNFMDVVTIGSGCRRKVMTLVTICV